MYKVFVNDCPLILTDTENISTSFKFLIFENTDILDVIEALFQNKYEGICLYCNDLDECWRTFQSNFKVQKAAGGKVYNLNKEVLFIYRSNKWDLPKGRFEIGESVQECAIREVEEECGITNLHVEKELETTYHIFKSKDHIILKITCWFLMNTSFTGELTPQIEDGIELALFKNSSETSEALKNTYQNIKLLF